jgi:hypothetical protein
MLGDDEKIISYYHDGDKMCFSKMTVKNLKFKNQKYILIIESNDVTDIHRLKDYIENSFIPKQNIIKEF